MWHLHAHIHQRGPQQVSAPSALSPPKRPSWLEPTCLLCCRPIFWPARQFPPVASEVHQPRLSDHMNFTIVRHRYQPPNMLFPKPMIYRSITAFFTLAKKSKHIVFCLLPLTFSWRIYFVSMWLNLMYLFLLSLRKINDDSKDPNNYVMRKQLIVVLVRFGEYVTGELYFVTYRTWLNFLAVFM